MKKETTLPVADKHLNRQLKPSEENRVWASDITYVLTKEGWLYVAVVMDLFSRKIVGWSMQDNMRTDLVCSALKGALGRRKPLPGLIHHSDRGVQYASRHCQDILRENKMICSMSRKGDCFDNAVVESFFGSLKNELIYLTHFETRIEAKQQIFDLH